MRYSHVSIILLMVRWLLPSIWVRLSVGPDQQAVRRAIGDPLVQRLDTDDMDGLKVDDNTWMQCLVGPPILIGNVPVHFDACSCSGCE